ncbi:GPP34 family phosphoprotein [Luteimonas sp. SJ-92]|uniref:GPP34 family phosphoprotein n=1 Tax=Luteimonas salinisoli TaxID=2752307 RepID=A0A853JF41_9GAMM|nr:GPP34 family phosphoprotein [Luteimonas salinisoli]NZA27961.1 GPP34 family phosphoprotein [Luteimonas salinisoli]
MKNPSPPTLAEDLLLVLFQPDSGAIAGENTLYYVLAGAVLAELAFNESATTTTTPTGSTSVEAVVGRAPSDEILRSAWDYAAQKPRAVKSMIAAIGPALRQPLLERLIARGDIREQNGKVLGMLKTTTLKDGGNGRRSGLIGEVRNVLVDGVEPTPRVAALAALMWGSGTLHQFEPEIPRSPVVIARARQLGRGAWSAEGATKPVARATAAMIGAIAASAAPPDSGPG